MAQQGTTRSSVAAVKEDVPGFCFDNYARNASLPLDKKMHMPTVREWVSSPLSSPAPTRRVRLTRSRRRAVDRGGHGIRGCSTLDPQPNSMLPHHRP